MANKGREVKVGAVVYRSFEKYFESAKRMAEKQGRPAPSYMTLYMRVRKGTSAASAMVNRLAVKPADQARVSWPDPDDQFGGSVYVKSFDSFDEAKAYADKRRKDEKLDRDDEKRIRIEYKRKTYSLDPKGKWTGV